METRFSILQSEKRCLFCNTTQNIHCHEVYFGRNRQKSIRDGCCVYLCGRHHNQSKYGVHFNKELNLSLKKTMETAWLKHYNKTIDDFIERYGKNYL